jgi:hypothetical protein
VIRKLRDVMPISRSCMLLRIILPVSVKSKMKAFLEENAIVIVAESATEKIDDENKSPSLVGDVAEGLAAQKHSLLEDDYEREKAQLAIDKTMFLDIKVDPELFRKVEEAVTTMAYGEYVLYFINLLYC